MLPSGAAPVCKSEQDVLHTCCAPAENGSSCPAGFILKVCKKPESAGVVSGLPHLQLQDWGRQQQGWR